MRVIYSGKVESLRHAVSYVNELFQREEFWRRISEKDRFDLSRHSGVAITCFMQSMTDPVEVLVVRPRNPFTSAVGYNDPRFPTRVYLYSHRLNRGISSLVNTIVHECVHSADRTSDGQPDIDFGHGSNSSAGKSGTAPYWIGDLAQRLYGEDATKPPLLEDFEVALDGSAVVGSSTDEVGGGSSFSGQPVVRWNGNRDMVLETDFSFRDAAGRVWNAPKGSCINGATIPRALWSAIGSPYTGKYRRASVVHDVAVGELCNPDVDPADRRAADRMFYEACRTDGCSKRFARLLYLGVRFGSWMAWTRPGMLSLDDAEDIPEDAFNEVRQQYWSLVAASDGLHEDASLEEIDLRVDSYLLQ